MLLNGDTDMNTNTLVIFQVICTDPVTGETDASKLETCRLHHAITEAQGNGIDEVRVWSEWTEDSRTGKITPSGAMMSIRLTRAAA